VFFQRPGSSDGSRRVRQADSRLKTNLVVEGLRLRKMTSTSSESSGVSSDCRSSVEDQLAPPFIGFRPTFLKTRKIYAKMRQRASSHSSSNQSVFGDPWDFFLYPRSKIHLGGRHFVTLRNIRTSATDRPATSSRTLFRYPSCPARLRTMGTSTPVLCG